MRSRRAVVVLATATVVGGGWAVAADTGRSRAEPPRAHAAQCASLGQAANYDVFSNGVYEATNTTLHGRAAAAGNVTLSAANIGDATTAGGDDLVSGGDVTGGNGQVSGSVRYAGTLDQAQNFTITGGSTKGVPPFSFADEFAQLGELSSSLAALPTTTGANAILQPWGALQINAPGATGPQYVFNIPGDLLAQALGVDISLPADATAVINVTGPHVSITQAQYMNLGGGITPQHIVWNFDGVSDLSLGGSVPWQGTVLAPRTDVTGVGTHNLVGQLIAANARTNSLAIMQAPFSGCLPAPPPAPLELSALCADVSQQFAMRLRNSGTRDLEVTWSDLDSAQGGSFTAFARHDRYFTVNVADGRTHHITVTAGSTTLHATAEPRACSARITVSQVVEGDSPGGAWTDVLSGSAGLVHSQNLADGESFSVDVPSGYVAGSVPVGEIPGGAVYEVTQPDPRGGTVVVSQVPITVTDGDDVLVTLTTLYPPTPVIPPDVVPPVQPTLPPGAPDPPSGPDLIAAVPGSPAADLEVTHSIRPRRLFVGDVVTTATRVRNLGSATASGTVLRELPQYPRLVATRVAKVLSLTTSAGSCRAPRPVRCQLGNMRPGQTIVVRARARVLVPGVLHSVVFASTTTAESNTTNNEGVAGLVVRTPSQLVRVHVGAPTRGRVGQPFSYRVTVTGAGMSGANGVRLCTPIPARFTDRSAPGTFGYKGLRCRDYARLGKGSSRSFVVQGVPAVGGRVKLDARATVTGDPRIARDSARALIAAPVCGSSVKLC